MQKSLEFFSAFCRSLAGHRHVPAQDDSSQSVGARNMIVTQHSLVSRMRDGVSDGDWQRFYALYEKAILAFAALSE